MPEPYDYGAVLRSGQSLVPDPATELLKRQYQQLQLQSAQQKIQAEQLKVQRQQAFGQAMQTYLQNPSGKGIAQIYGQFPEYAKQASDAWDAIDKSKRDSDVLALGELTALGAKGNYGAAAERLKQRIDANKAAGQDTSGEQMIYDDLSSGDPARQKQALAVMGVHLAAAVGPEHAKNFMESLGLDGEGGTKGQVVGRAIGHYEGGEFKVDYRDPDAPQYREVKTVDANGNEVTQIVAVGGEGGGGTSTGDGGGFANAVNFVLKHEGGYNPSDRNGAPVNFGINQRANPDVDVKSLTRDQATQIYKTRYWDKSGAANLPANMQTPYFDTYVINPAAAKRFLKASGNDPNRFLDLRQNWLKSLEKGGEYDRAWTQRTADLQAMVASGGSGGGAGGGGVVYTAPGGKREAYHLLSPAEKQARGLDANTQYQVNEKTGQIAAVGGQQRQAKQIPQTVQNKSQQLIDVRDTMARLAGTWNPAYGGHFILGNTLNVLQGRLTGIGPAGMRDWWADFQSMDNVVRNQLFGSALTAHEKAAYAGTTIDPSMTPAQIVKNFNRRRSIINAVVARQQNFLKKNGYDPDAVDALFQPLSGEAGGAASAPDKAGWVTLPSGLKIRKVR